MHIIPFVFKIVIGVAHSYGLQGVRSVREPILPLNGFWSNLFTINYVKTIVLNILSVFNQRITKAYSVQLNDYLIGILHSGILSHDRLKTLLTNIRKRDVNPTVELLFHPGRASEKEQHIWDHSNFLKKFYTSEARVKEASFLKDPKIKILLRSF